MVSTALRVTETPGSCRIHSDELMSMRVPAVLRSQENGRCEGFFNGRMEGPNPTKTCGIRIKTGGGDLEKKV